MRLHWVRGRTVEDGPGDQDRAREWLGCDDAGEAIARVVRVSGPLWSGWRLYRAVALDDDARVVELRPSVDEDRRWLVVVGDRVVGRAALPLQAVRTAEAALRASG
jgi:hypothetical protein